MLSLLLRPVMPPALHLMSSHGAQKHIGKFACIEPLAR